MSYKSKQSHCVLIICVLFAAALPVLAEGPASASKGTMPEVIFFRCPDSVPAGIKVVPSGWSDFFSTRQEIFTGSSAEVQGRTMVCEYGSYMLHRPFPPGYTCKIGKTKREIECTNVKPPIKIPGKNPT